MKFKMWLGSSIILTLAVIGSMALFYYWEQPRLQSVQMLQDRVNEVELQRFLEDKGSQVQAASKQTADEFSRSLLQTKQQTEALVRTLQLQNKTPAWISKRQLILQQAIRQWPQAESFLTDETGLITARTGKSTISSLAATAEFKQAKQQPQAAVAYSGQVGTDPFYILITVPAFSDAKVFQGVLQIKLPITNEYLKKITPKGGFTTLVASVDGTLLSKGLRADFPKNIAELLGKTTKELSQTLQGAGSHHFKARWKDTSYIVDCMMTQTPTLWVFTLLEVSGVERVVGPVASNESVFSDPVVIIGLGGILLISCLLILLFSGAPIKTIKKINYQLMDMLNAEGSLRILEAPGKGDLGKLADLVNHVIERAQKPEPGTLATSVNENPQTTEELTRVNQALEKIKNEMEELHQSYDQVLVQNQTLSQQVEGLTAQNHELQNSLEAGTGVEHAQPPMPAEKNEQLEELILKVKEEGTLRIEAISQMSEDLKATLMVIKNYISSILSSEEGKITDSQQEFLGVVINKSARLERQINDLLDISHMESGVTQIYRSRTDLVSMIQDVVLNSQPQAETKQVKITQEMHTPLPQVLIDSDRIGQIFINLVQHAIKITPVGGEVRITGTETLTDIVIKIRDGGTPISAAQATKVFTEFHGSDSNSGPDIAGSGLRFPIIQRIVASHQGKVAMRGLLDKGNETVVSFAKTNELLAPAIPETQTMESFEIKQAVPAAEKDKDTQSETADSPFDLSSFMGKMEEYEIKAKPATPAESPTFPGAEEDLNKLLNDIEKMNEKME